MSLEHILAAIAKARSLNSYAGEGAAQTVYDQGGQSLALNVLSDDQQLLASLNNLLERSAAAPECWTASYR